MRKLKWERAGLREDMVKYLEVRDYTPADVIQAHYTEAIKRRRSDKKEDHEIERQKVREFSWN